MDKSDLEGGFAQQATSRRKNTPPPKRSGSCLVVFGEHDGQHPRGLLGVGRVFRTERHALIVAVDSPKELATGEFEASDVVLAVGSLSG